VLALLVLLDHDPNPSALRAEMPLRQWVHLGPGQRSTTSSVSNRIVARNPFKRASYPLTCQNTGFIYKYFLCARCIGVDKRHESK